MQGQPAVFLDTEFVGEGRYYPALGAIQLGVPDEAALIDPLTVRDLSPLFALLVDPQVEKVFHAAGQDLAIFYRLMGRPVDPIYDTQLAAGLIGSDYQISFGNLVERVTGTHLQKAHGFTDWLRRPLTPEQIEYALDDVRFLIPVYEHQRAQLERRGRLEWAREEFCNLEDPARFMPPDPQDLYLRIRGVDRLRGTALAALQLLVAWREETARTLDIPIGHIARDEVLMELARHPRSSVKELKDIRGFNPQQINRFGAGLIAAAQEATKATKVPRGRPASFPSELEATVDFLTLCLRSLASEEGVAYSLIATRGDLTDLVVNGSAADVPLLRGWRRQAFGEPLLLTLDGKATARILPHNRQVHLDWH